MILSRKYFNTYTGLLQNNIPKDIIGLCFDYIGYINDDKDDNLNPIRKVDVLYRYQQTEDDNVLSKKTRLYYCSCCNNYYIKSKRIKRHLKSKKHYYKRKKNEISNIENKDLNDSFRMRFPITLKLKNMFKNNINMLYIISLDVKNYKIK
jgi:hypothetical protein